MAKRKRVEEGDGDEQQRNVKQCVDNDTSQKCLKKERKAKAGGPETSKNIVEEDHGHEKRLKKARKLKSAAPETGTSVVEDDTSKTKLKRKEKGKSKPPETSTSVVKASEDDGSEKYYTKEGKATSIIPEKSTSAVGAIEDDKSKTSSKKRKKSKSRTPETSTSVGEEDDGSERKYNKEKNAKPIAPEMNTSAIEEDHGHVKRSKKAKKLKFAAPEMGTSDVEDDTSKTELKIKGKGKSKSPETSTSVVKASKDDGSEKYYKKERKAISIVPEKSTSAVEVIEDDKSKTSSKKRKKSKSKPPETSTSVGEVDDKSDKSLNQERKAKFSNTLVECEEEKIQSHLGGDVLKGDAVIVIKGDLELLNGRGLHLEDDIVHIQPERKDLSQTFAVPGIIIKVMERELMILADNPKDKGDDGDGAFKTNLPETFKLKVQRYADGTEETVQGCVEICYLPGLPSNELHDKAKREISFPPQCISEELPPRAWKRISKTLGLFTDELGSFEELGREVADYFMKYLFPLSLKRKNSLDVARRIWIGHGRFFNVSKQVYFKKLKDVHYRFGNEISPLYIGRVLDSNKIFPGTTHTAKEIYDTLFSVYKIHFGLVVRQNNATQVKHLRCFKFAFDKYGELCSLDYAKRFDKCIDSDPVYIDFEYDLEDVERCETFRFPRLVVT